jgi:aminoglycoside phosphotransferase (APT) family kinase protein
MKEPIVAPATEVVQTLLDVLAPGSSIQGIAALPGSFSNASHVVEILDAGGTRSRIVIRRYAIFRNYDREEKARREYLTLKLLRAHGIPVPEPLYLDEQGDILGSPGIVTRFTPGNHLIDPPDPVAWARAMATMLVRIHAVPCSLPTTVLLDANSDAAWFAHSATVPRPLVDHADGPRVWRAVRDLLPHMRPASPVLTHLDYWPGNILWHDGEISAIVDWEEASYGDPGVDVAYGRMHLLLLGMEDAAEAFLETYQAVTGCPVENLALWDLTAATRAMPDPARLRFGALGALHCTEQSMRHALRRLIDDALGRAVR